MRRAVDWESVADELYGLRPDRFTAARNERALAARTAGDQVLAARIRALRRPTLAAWTSNLLVRERPDETRALVALGEGLRQAHHELDGERLRELSRRRHAVVSALAREARQLAADAGQPVGEDVQHEVEATLHAVLADPGAAEEWAAGRLTKPLSAPVGFDAAATDAAAHRPARRPATPEEAAKAPSRSPGTGTARKAEKEDKEKQRRRAEEEAAEQRARRERIERAREEAAMARREAEERAEEHQRAEAERQRAQADLHDAEQRAAVLAEELQRAEERRHTAAAEARGARDRARVADRSARHARHRAEEAAERLARAADDR
ncbi:hypothetical protein [Streptomyces sp. NRRL S-118]|uniref:hypothetical protein n=1 Tax=Streptomyces sp. NRRL S-118 TaxID=1463881 RepID=UPI001F17AD0D|nr:hypothetical protein [Streptomyces sp. NRRL S-118]